MSIYILSLGVKHIQHGSFADVPLDRILGTWRRTYGTQRVNGWIEALEQAAGRSQRNFFTEDVIHDDSH